MYGMFLPNQRNRPWMEPIIKTGNVILDTGSPVMIQPAE
jgi:hypothetical protein